MNRTSPLLWVAVILIFLLPTAAGRILLDLAGGLMLIFLTLPLLLLGAGWIGWRVLKSRMVTCSVCGASILTDTTQCPACGSLISNKEDSNDSSFSTNNNIPASSATIDITAKDVDKNQ